MKFAVKIKKLEKNIFETLSKSYPQNIDFKSHLAVAFQFLGGTYSSTGNLDKALTFFEKYNFLAKELYEIYCAICHGNAGDGKGKLVTQGKYLGVPSYKDRVITGGSVFHVQQFGINSMGSYATQMSKKERWLVSAYVMKLKSEL